MPFSQIIGHEQPKKIFQNALAEGRFAHAYLLHGVSGVGKKSLAMALAANLFCPDRTIDACGVCPTCGRVEQNKHPDFFIIEPSGNTIKIEQIREIQKRVQLKPYEGTIKVFLLTDAECMTREATNCLLKMLEEPPSDTVFLLTANNLYSIMPTIISRCQTIPVGKVSLEKIEHLLQNHGLEAEQAKLYASLSDGVPGAALQLAVSGKGQEIRRIAFDLENVILKRDINDLIKKAEEVEKKQELPEIIDQLMLWYRDRLIWSQTGDKQLIVNKDRFEELKALSQDKEKLLEGIECLLEAKNSISQNVNTRLVLEVLLLRLAGMVS